MFKIFCKRFDKIVTISDCFECDLLIQVNPSAKYVECGDNSRRDFCQLFYNDELITDSPGNSAEE